MNKKIETIQELTNERTTPMKYVTQEEFEAFKGEIRSYLIGIFNKIDNLSEGMSRRIARLEPIECGPPVTDSEPSSEAMIQDETPNRDREPEDENTIGDE